MDVQCVLDYDMPLMMMMTMMTQLIILCIFLAANYVKNCYK